MNYVSWTRASRRALIVAEDMCDNNEYIGALIALTSVRVHVDTLAPNKTPPETFRTAIQGSEGGCNIQTTVDECEASHIQFDAVVLIGSAVASKGTLNVIKKCLQRRECTVAALSQGATLLVAAGLTKIPMSGHMALQEAVQQSDNIWQSDALTYARAPGGSSIITAAPHLLGICMAYVVRNIFGLHFQS